MRSASTRIARLFLFDTVPPSDVSANLNSHATEGATLCVALTDSAFRSANAADLDSSCFLEYLSKEDWKEIDKNVTEWYGGIPDIPVEGEKTLKEYFWQDDVSYWWFMEQFLVFPGGLFDLVKYVHTIRTILDKVEPSSLLLYVRDPSLHKAIHHFASKRGLELQDLAEGTSRSSRTRGQIRVRLSRLARTIYYRLAYLHPLPRLLSWWISITRFVGGHRPLNGQPLILSFAPYSMRLVHNPEDGSDRVADTYWDATEQEIAKRHPDMRVLHVAIRTDRAQDRSVLGQLRSYGQLLSLSPAYVPLEYYMGIKEAIQINRMSRDLERRWTRLVESGATRQLFEHAGIDFRDEFESYFERLLPAILGRAARYMKLMDRVIRVEKPGVAALNGESQCVGRALIAACQRGGVPTVGLQHGCLSLLFCSDDLSYYHTSSADVRYEDSCNDYGCPIPTRTLVWGDYWKRGLVEGMHFPPGSIALTGNPRYDTLKKVDKYDRSAIRERLRLSPDKFTVLYPTASATYRSDFQPVDNNAIHMRAVLNCFEALGDDVQLIIKFHPVDDMRVYDGDLQERWKHTNIRLVEHDDVLALISVSDLLITRYSGTIIEAAAFGVSSINLNLINVPDNIDFVGQGGALGVTREEDLCPAVLQFMGGGDISRALEERRGSFLQEWIHGNDGQSSNRVMNLMIDLSRTKAARQDGSSDGA